MRRKSTRNSTKAAEKPKPAEPAAKKGRRSSRRRRKSTSSESEKSEDEVQMDVSQETEAQSESDRGESPERITRGGRKRKSDVKSASKRKGSPDRVDEEGSTCKGKSKGKNKSKVDKGDHPTEYQSETCKESEISTNAQVTPQSPETVNDKPVCESAVVDEKPDTDGNDQDATAKDDLDKDRADVENQPAGTIENNTSDVETKEQADTVLKSVQNDTEKEDNEQKSSVVTKDTIDEAESKIVDEQQTENDSEKLNTEVNHERSTEVKPAEDSTESADQSQNDDIQKTEESTENEPEKIEETKPELEVVEPEHSEEKSNEEPSREAEEEPNSDKGAPAEDTSTTEDNCKEDEPSRITEDQEKPEEAKNGIEENTEDETPRTFDDSKASIEEKQDSDKNEKSSRMSTETQEEDEKPEPSSERKCKLKLPERRQKIKLNRVNSTNSESSETGTRHKRTWGGGLKLFTPTADVDSTVVKTIFPTAHLLEESEVKLESEPKIRKISTADSTDGKKDRRVSMESHGYDRQTSDESRRESTDQEPDNSNIIAFNRKISIIDDSGKSLKAPPSPAKNPTSDVLFITNLVRPFTLKHLRELLERTGKIKEDGFWTDKIKSKCYVQYETEEEAKATREALHGVNWPTGNSKKLIIDYGTVEEMEKAKNPPQPVVEVSKSDKENEEEQKKKSERAEAREDKEPTKEKREHVREWDVGKEDLHRPKSRGRDHSEKRRHSRRSSSPADDYSSKKRKKVEEQVPQKLMDDLFQKTKATPSIYWQPLTPEEIATKQRQRLERMAEHKKMLETSRGSRSDFGRGAPYRRKYD